MEQFRSTFNNEMFIGANVVCNAGVPTVIASYQIPAGEEVSLGFGGFSDQVGAIGRNFIDLEDANGAVEGLVRISVHSPQDRPLAILTEGRTEILRQGATDRRLQVPLPFDGRWLAEDRKMVVEFIADATKTVTKADSVLLIDVTKNII